MNIESGFPSFDVKIILLLIEKCHMIIESGVFENGGSHQENAQAKQEIEEEAFEEIEGDGAHGVKVRNKKAVLEISLSTADAKKLPSLKLFCYCNPAIFFNQSGVNSALRGKSFISSIYFSFEGS